MRVLVWILAGVTIASPVVAAPGSAALARARQAWDDGALEQAEHSYEDALAQGGLNRAATLDCWVHLGAARSVRGNKAGALGAYRTALFIDDQFVVPADAGRKAVTLAEAARRQPNQSPLRLAVHAPSGVASGEPFEVGVTMEATQPIVARVALHVRDHERGRSWDDVGPAAALVHFHVPAALAFPGVNLRLQAAALDAHDNELATVEDHLSVRPTPIADTHATRRPLTGFWSTPWPYVVGGVLVAAGAATGAYFLSRTPDQVSIGPALVRTY